MSYIEVPENFYQMLEPETPWHAGAKGWTKAPWVTWGNNPNLVGPPRLGVGQEPERKSLIPLLLAAGGVVAVLALAAGALGSAGAPYSSRRYKPNPSFTKLRSGDWGVRGEGPAPARGASVVVNKKDGSSKYMTIDRVVWQDGSAWIAAVASEPRGGGRGGGGSRSSASGCARCRYIPGQRTSQIWEDCEYCGAEPIYV